MRFIIPLFVGLLAVAVSSHLPTSTASSLAISDTLAASPQTEKLRINGWFPCFRSKPPRENKTAPAVEKKTPPAFECAEVTMPLCHTGVCTSSKTINLFVKRLKISSANAVPRKVMWVLQGGPGRSLHAMEGHMLKLNSTMNGSADLYTLDHRGTGRSSFLDCQAAQAYTAGSPRGVKIGFDEVANCVKDILFQIDDHTEAFSVTSAAKDVEFLIRQLNGKALEVFIYGASYGTYWAERIMHLAPLKVKGYILDGVVSEAVPSFTMWNTNRKFPESRFIKICENDTFCSAKLAKFIQQHGDLTSAWRALYHTIDVAAPRQNACADLARNLAPKGSPPSHGLRDLLGDMVTHSHERIVIPAVLYRLSRCREQDVSFLREYFGVSDPDHLKDESKRKSPMMYDQIEGSSSFLGMLIRASEMWTKPSTSWEHETTQFKNGLLASNMTYTFGMYCMLQANTSDPACSNLINSHSKGKFPAFKDLVPFTYEPDEYWQRVATIPDHASVMVITGGLDFQTVQEKGVSEYEHLSGGQGKILVEFDNGGHCAGISGSIFGDETRCGVKMITSYVIQGGDVDKVDTTCMNELPEFNFADLKALQVVAKNVGSVADLYDSRLK